MVEGRTRRPLSSQAQARAEDEQRLPTQADEESLLEDLTRLRAQLAEVRSKAAEFREQIRSAERDSAKMDKLLQELLSEAKGGTGVSGAVLDQLRDDLQALLRAKRHANEARQKLDEKDSKIVMIRQDLKETKLAELENDVQRAREEAKVKAHELELQGRHREVFADAFQRQKALFDEIVVVQNSVAEIHQKSAMLQDERVHFESMAKEHEEQKANLEDKRYEVERQKEQCEERLQELGDVQEIHQQKKQACAELSKKLAEVKSAIRAGESVPRNLPHWRLKEELLEPGFQPLRQDADFKAVKLLRALQRAEGEVLPTLRLEDRDQDGRLDPFEVAQGMRKLAPLEDAQLEGANSLFAALAPGLAPNAQGSVAFMDLTLGAQLQARAVADPPLLTDFPKALRWAARRNEVPERDVRSRLAQCLRQAPSSSRVQAEGTKLGMQLGLTEGDAISLGRHLEEYQERFCYSLPSWRIRSHKSKASLLARFVHQVAKYREALLPFLQDDTLELEEFLRIGEKLGPEWSEEDLSEIALLLDVSPQDTEGCKALPPILSSWRLRHAIEPNGFAAQFPHAAGLCNRELLDAVEEAATKPGRRTLPSASAPAAAAPAPPPPPAPPAETAAANAPKAAAPGETSASARPASPTKSAGDASYGDDDFDEEFEDDFEEVEDDVEEEEA